MDKIKFNLIVLGDGCVGKTCLLNQYVDEKFDEQHMTTLGIDYKQKNYTLQCSNQEVEVKIWDTAGQERFRTLTHAFYKKAQGVIVTYDVTSKESFESLQMWMKSIDEHADENVCKVMVGNKIDMKDQRVVQEDQARQLANQYGIHYFETSAKENIGVKEVFENLMNQVIKKKSGGQDEDEPPKRTTISRRTQQEDQQQQKKKKCC